MRAIVLATIMLSVVVEKQEIANVIQVFVLVMAITQVVVENAQVNLHVLVMLVNVLVMATTRVVMKNVTRM